MKSWLMPLLIFIIALAVRVSFLDGFITVDEPVWIERSRMFTAGLLFGDFECPPVFEGRQFSSVGWGCTFQAGHPGVTTTWLGGLGLLYYWQANLSGQTDLLTFLDTLDVRPLNPALIEPARIFSVIVNALFVPVFYYLIARLFSRRVAIIASLLVALSPFHIALSRVLHQDALTTTFMVPALLMMMGYWLAGWKKRWLLGSGVFAGLSFLSKTVSWYLMPGAAMMGLLGLYYWRQAGEWHGWGAEIKPTLAEGLLWALAAIITVVALFPAMWVMPLSTISGIFNLAFQYATTGHSKGEYFLGAVTNDPGLLFYPVGWLLQTSPLEVLGVLALPVAGWATLKKQGGLRSYLNTHPLETALSLSLITFFIFMNTSDKKFVRYFLPAFPLIAVWAAMGLLWLTDRLIAPAALKRRTWPILAGIILLVHGSFIYRNAPDYFTYYNPIFGDNKTVAQIMTIFGWGGEMREAADYLDRLPNAESLRVVAWYSQTLMPFFAGTAADFSSQMGDNLKVDYLVFHQNQLQRHLVDPNLWGYFNSHYQPAYTVTKNGLDYVYIYPNPIHHHVNWPENNPAEGLSVFGYNLTPTGTVTLFWQNLAVEPSTIAAGIAPAAGGEPLWTACRPGPNFTATPGELMESNCAFTLTQLAPGVYHLRLALADTPSPRPLDFPAGELALYLDSSGQLTAIDRDTAQRRLIEQALPPEVTPVQVTYHNLAQLVGYRVEAAPQPQLTLYWLPLQPLGPDFAKDFEVKLQLIEANSGATMLETTQPLLAAVTPPLGQVTAVTYPLTGAARPIEGPATLKTCLTIAATGQPVPGVSADNSQPVDCISIPATDALHR